MFDFEAWHKNIGLYIVRDLDENSHQYEKRLMKEASDAVIKHLADDGK